MHDLFWVAIHKDHEKTKTPQDVVEHVTQHLIGEGFCETDDDYENLAFGSGLADWFVIGGRWHGVFQLNANYFTNEVGSMLEENDLYKNFFPEIRHIWDSYGGKGLSVFDLMEKFGTGWCYGKESPEANVILGTPQIRKYLIESYENKRKEFFGCIIYKDNSLETMDSISEIPENEFSNFFFVPVDYHS